MTFGDRVRARREELQLSRAQLAKRLGVTTSAVSNYEIGISFPKEEILLRMFNALHSEPNELFQDSFYGGGRVLNTKERTLIKRFRDLSPLGRDAVMSLMDALRAYREELEEHPNGEPEQRMIPLYENPAAAGYASPVFGEDFDYLPVTDDVPPAAEYAVRISGDSMTPYIQDDSIVYVNRDPIGQGDVGIFCVDGEMFCKQYRQDASGTVYLFSLNRNRADADIVLTPGSGRTAVCMGRVILQTPPPLPGLDS